MHLLKELAKNHAVTALTFQHDKNLKILDEKDGYTISRIPWFVKISKGFISFRSIIIFFIQTLKADTVIINLPNVEAIPLAIFAKLLNKKLICIFHCDVRLGKSPIQKFISQVVRWSVTFQISLADKVVAYTKDYVNSLPYKKLFDDKTSFHVPPVIPLQTNSDFLKQTKKKDTIQIGFAGRIAKEKGVEYLIEAVNNLKDRTNKEIEILFAGPYGKDVVGEHAYYQKILTLLKKTKTQHTFLGTLANKELGSFYKAIDVLVLPSINQTEAFGMVQVEAIMAKTPVIASNLPGVRVPIQESGFGEIVQPMDADGLSKAIENIIDSKTMFNEGKRKNFVSKFNLKSLTKLFV